MLITAFQSGTLCQQLLQGAHVIVTGSVVQVVVHGGVLGVGGKAGEQGEQHGREWYTHGMGSLVTCLHPRKITPGLEVKFAHDRQWSAE
ncbi:hypothetical protein D3C80_1607380 [compost metagenome]